MVAAGGARPIGNFTVDVMRGDTLAKRIGGDEIFRPLDWLPGVLSRKAGSMSASG